MTKLTTVDNQLANTAPSPVQTYLDSLPSESSRRVMMNGLRTIAGAVLKEQTGADVDVTAEDVMSFEWHNLKYQTVVTIKSILIDRYAPSSVNRMMSALRRVAKESWLLGLMDFEEYTRIIQVKDVKYNKVPAGRDIQPLEVRALLVNCQQDSNTTLGLRDLAIFALLHIGLRRNEIANLPIENYERSTGKLVVIGKGRKERTQYLSGNAKRHMDRWLAERGSGAGGLILGVNRGGNIVMTKRNGEPAFITSQAVYKMLSKRAESVGITDISPHDFRRSVTGDLIDANVDLITVSHLLGHSDPKTTAGYDRRGERVKENAMQRIDLPL